MIESASFPKDLSEWGGPAPAPQYYFELFGETTPMLDTSFSQVVPPAGSDGTVTEGNPVYEYYWTLGHDDFGRNHHDPLFDRTRKRFSGELEDVAARVSLYFPVAGGWRINEVGATVKYLSPISDYQDELTRKIGEDWRTVQPVLGDAGNLATSLVAIPGIGAAAAGAAPLLSAMAKLRVGSVPQGVAGFDWFVEKKTLANPDGRGLYQGVSWTLPREMFEKLGGRLNGSLAVNFVPARVQGSTVTEPLALPILGHASLFFKQDPAVSVPPDNGFVELMIQPASPPSLT